MKLIVGELEEMNEQFQTPRLSVIEDEVKEIVIDQKAMIADEQVMVTITRDGYVKKVSLRSWGSSQNVPTGRKESDVLLGWAQTSTLQTLVVYTDQGRYGEVPVFKLTEARWKDTGTHLSAWLKLDASENRSRLSAPGRRPGLPHDPCDPQRTDQTAGSCQPVCPERHASADGDAPVF